jgi:hypothetical protein
MNRILEAFDHIGLFFVGTEDNSTVQLADVSVLRHRKVAALEGETYTVLLKRRPSDGSSIVSIVRKFDLGIYMARGAQIRSGTLA